MFSALSFAGCISLITPYLPDSDAVSGPTWSPPTPALPKARGPEEEASGSFDLILQVACGMILGFTSQAS